MKKLVLLLLIGSSVLFARDLQVVNNTKHKVKVKVDVEHAKDKHLTLKKYSNGGVNVPDSARKFHVEVTVDLHGSTDRHLNEYDVNPDTDKLIVNTLDEGDKAYEIDKGRR